MTQKIGLKKGQQTFFYHMGTVLKKLGMSMVLSIIFALLQKVGQDQLNT